MAKKIIIDCDPGIDDALALYFAHEHSNLDILGIIVNSGNTSAKKSFINVLRLFKHWKKDYPLYIGKENPISRELINAEDTHGEDGLGGINLPYDKKDYIYGGVDFLIENSNNADCLFALGPLTNIAVALKKDRDAFKDLPIYIMGGSFLSHGNSSPVAEYNFLVDPEAADYVLLNYPGDIHLFPLDITRQFILTPNIIAFMKKINTHKGQFVESITSFYMDFHYEYENIIGSVINDPLPLMAYTKKELFSYNEYYARVQSGGLTDGMLVVDRKSFYKKEKNIKLYEDINAKSSMDYFIETIFKEMKDTNNEIY